ncbi:polyhydroxyalkanoate synthesis repressor PhaR [Altererythrobacter sp. ZODW24]|uniref:polyhydroxyalkanoate synthesis repressor PhaR n=1 Tax=Altererythrobacter sp. ZODW24 TaxID=2185142 RepID=UPI000DF82031|nr:polyhydroxyalkanoate synthesis repressor PhaR [Altererythrobacter sp. ZODW24]
MAKRSHVEGDKITIKKYANRRLYNTASSSYITLDDLAEMTRKKLDFQVLDAKSGDDITHSILTQIIMEEEASGGEQMLPVSFLRDLIGMYGNSMQSMMPQFLEASMTNFRKNQTKLREAFESGIGGNPIAKLAETNLAMMKAATDAFMPGARPKKDDAKADSKRDDELAALKAQMAEMQKKLDKLGD